MPTPVTLRPAATPDFPAITAIYAHHVLHGSASFEREAPSVEEMQRRHAEVQAGQLPYLVAERGGEVLGYAYAHLYHARPAYGSTVENSVYIQPEHAGQGLGKALLQAVIDQCEALGYRQMLALVGDSQNRASIALHERLGFRQVGTFEAVGFKFGRWLDVVLMQRALGQANATPPLARP